MKQPKTKNKKQNTGLHFIAIVLVAITIISSSIGLFAWSKYTSFLTNSATASIAKWSFDLKLKNGPKAGSAEETTGPIDLAETIDFTHVKSGTIAPGTNGEFQVIVNTGDTEVDCFYEVTIGLTNCPRNITFSRVDESNTTTVLSAGGASNTNSRTLYFSKYLQAKKVDGNTTTNENGKHIETITWNWPYELTTGSNEAKTQWDDRDKEDMGLTISMTITAKGTEVMNAPLSTATVTYGSGTEVANGGTITLKLGDESTESTTLSMSTTSSSGTESVSFSSSDSTVAEVDSTGKVTGKKAGNAVITIIGNQTGKTFTVNVTVKPKLEIHVGDTIRYTPSTVNEYEWDKSLATSDQTGTEKIYSGANQTYNIPEWYVLSVNGDNITMVPKNPSASVRFQDAQGYNNAVKLLNDACSALYSDSSKGITARSINIEDIENVINTYGNSDTLTTAKTSLGYNTQKYSAYLTENSIYPEIYASEDKNVINETEGTGIGLSEQVKNAQNQTRFIERTAENNNNGTITTAASIRPYQTYYYLNNTDFVTALGGSTSIYRKVLLNNGLPNYWVASRCVYLNSSFCNFNVRNVNSGGLRAGDVYHSSGYPYDYSRGLFPVVSLSSDVLTTTSTTGIYQVQ